MKLLRIGFILSLLLTLIFFNLNCSDTELINNSNSNNGALTDDQGEEVGIFVQEYVYVVPQNGDPFYTWYQIDYISCNSNCFTSPNPSMVYDNFMIPDSIRTIEGDQFISQGQHRFVYGGSWICRSNNWAILFHVTRGLNTYFYAGYPMGVGVCTFDPNMRTGSYQNTSSTIYSMYSNLTYSINYGITTVGGEDE